MVDWQFGKGQNKFQDPQDVQENPKEDAERDREQLRREFDPMAIIGVGKKKSEFVVQAAAGQQVSDHENEERKIDQELQDGKEESDDDKEIKVDPNEQRQDFDMISNFVNEEFTRTQKKIENEADGEKVQKDV